MTTAELQELINEKIITGGRRTTAQFVRDLMNEVVLSFGNLSGFTMTGDLILNADATADFQAVTYQQLKQAVIGLWDDRGNYNASGDTFPSSGGSGDAGAIRKGDIWTVSISGVLGGVPVNVGDTVRALEDAPGQDSELWAIGEGNIGYVPWGIEGNTLGASGYKLGSLDNQDWDIVRNGTAYATLINNGIRFQNASGQPGSGSLFYVASTGRLSFAADTGSTSGGPILSNFGMTGGTTLGIPYLDNSYLIRQYNGSFVYDALLVANGGNVLISNTTGQSPTARLQVKGFSNLDANLAFLLQDISDNDLFHITEAGNAYLSGTINDISNIVSANFNLRELSDNTGAVLANWTSTTEGIKYSNDLSATFVDRSLIDKGFANATYALATDLLIPLNGLSASGSNVILGGALTMDTDIEGGAFANWNLTLGGLNYLGNFKVYAKEETRLEQADDSQYFVMNSTGAYLQGNDVSIVSDTDSFVIDSANITLSQVTSIKRSDGTIDFGSNNVYLNSDASGYVKGWIGVDTTSSWFAFNSTAMSIAEGVLRFNAGSANYAELYTTNLTVARQFQFPNASGTLALLEGGTYTGTIYTDAGIDVTATGGSDVLNIGTTNADVINIGNSATVINLIGTALFEYQANQYVTDKLITLNYGGAAASGLGVGFEIEENSVITGYVKTNGTRTGYVLKAPANAGVLEFITLSTDVTLTAGQTGVIATLAGTETFTNKTYDTAGTGNVFKINGTTISAITGTGSAVLATSPTLVTPTLGVAAATSINKVTITAPATSATLTLADGSTLALSGAFSTTFTATATTNVTLPTSGTLSIVTDVQVFTSNGTWTKPNGAKAVWVLVIGSGGGGGSGRKSNTGVLATGGGGGASGSSAMMTFQASDLSSTVTIVIGAGGAGGAAQSTNSTDGNAGSIGSAATNFTGYLMAQRGGGGGAGNATGAAAGGTANPAMFNGIAGGASSATGGVGTAGGNPVAYCGTGGGAGGGITTGNVAAAGGAGGVFNSVNAGTAGGTAGAADTGTAGGAGSTATWVGTGGGGGGGSTVGNAGDGGNGANYGAGGGGGGAARDGVGNSGKGGNGAGGICIVITYF